MHADILIVGAGFAGASTAFHLSRSFPGSILILEREDAPGRHASGRNASLVLQSTSLREVRTAVMRSRQFFSEHSDELGFRQTGSLLLGREEALQFARQAGSPSSESIDSGAATALAPLLEGHAFEQALWTTSDGVIDIALLLQWYLRGALEKGARLLCGTAVNRITRTSGYRVETTRGVIETPCLVNAAGAWAPEIAEMAGAARLPLTPLKRHLFHLRGAAVPPDSPFVWSLDQNFYFRSDGEGLLFSLCEEERSDTLQETVSPGIQETLLTFLQSLLPRLRGAEVSRVWSCFRTKTDDGRFVIGWDPQIEDFLWVAGLGGHGVGSSWAVGDLAASILQRRPHSGLQDHAPERWTRREHARP